MSCIRWVPWSAASTSRTSTPATPSASSPTTATMTTQVRLEPLTLTEFAASAGTSLDNWTSWNSERKRCRSGTNEWPGVYARTGRTMNTGPLLTITLPHRYLDDKGPKHERQRHDAPLLLGKRRGEGSLVRTRGPGASGVQAGAAADGQLIRTLTPELVEETRTSSARPEITASPNPAGMAAPPSWLAGRLGRAGPAARARGLARGRRRMIADGHHEPLVGVGHLDPDRFGRAVPPVRFDRARAGLAHREAHLIKQGLVHPAAPRHRGGDQPRGTNVRGQRRERYFNGGHLG